jgi:hypothetical protein
MVSQYTQLGTGSFEYNLKRNDNPVMSQGHELRRVITGTGFWLK